jgi:hypothetical protein
MTVPAMPQPDADKGRPDAIPAHGYDAPEASAVPSMT